MSNDNKPTEPFPFDFGGRAWAEEPPELRDARLRQAKGRRRKSANAPHHPDQPQPLRFDPYRRAKSPTLKACIVALIGHLEAHEKRERRRRPDDARHFAIAVEALVCNLLVLHMVNPARPLAVPRANDVLYLLGKDKPEAYGKHFTTAIDLMIACELISQPQLGHNFKNGPKQPTLLELNAAKAAAHLPVGAVTWDDFRHAPWGDVLILKPRRARTTASTEADLEADAEGLWQARDRKGNRLRLSQTTDVLAMEDEVRTLNAILDTADFGVDGASVVSWENPETGRLIDPTQRQLRRIFNNGSLMEGGRLYHGFWETMPRAVRYAALRIEGEPVANVDFRSLFARLCYVEADTPPPMDDLYDIEGRPDDRDDWKRLLNALLFMDHEPRQWPDGVSQRFRRTRTLRQAVAMLKARHPAIAHLFGTGIGLKLMYTESRILLTALPRLYAAGIVALPLHDSVLTAKSKAEAAKVIMEEAYMEVTGQDRAFVTIG